jgi:hypothetical protein
MLIPVAKGRIAASKKSKESIDRLMDIRAKEMCYLPEDYTTPEGKRIRIPDVVSRNEAPRKRKFIYDSKMKE